MLSGKDAEQGRDFTLHAHTPSPSLHGQGRLPCLRLAVRWRHGGEARGAAAGTQAAPGAAEGQHRPSLRRLGGRWKVWVSITREESTCFL